MNNRLVASRSAFRSRGASPAATLCALVPLCLGALSSLAWADLSACNDATCRITATDGSRGSGCVFEIGQGQVYVLTAAHVVGQDSTVACEFWRDGHQSAAVAGRVITRVDNARSDAAIVAVAAAQLGGRLPGVIPVAPPDLVLQPGETIVSVGCARGAWSTGWKGHVQDYRDTDMLFVPAPAEGRSGSAVFDAEGRYIVGVVRARTADNAVGIACSVQALYQDLGRAAAEQRTQCPSGECQATPAYRLFSRRQPQESSPSHSANPWPTLPPNAPSVDLAPITNRLDRLADALTELKPQPASAPQPTPTPDPETVKALQQLGSAVQGINGTVQQHGQAIEQIRSDVPKAIDAAVKPIAEQVGKIDQAVRPLEAVHAKLDAMIEQGGLRGKIAERVEQAAEDPTAWIKHSLIALAVMVVIGLAAAVIHAIHAHKAAMKAGQPDPTVKALDGLAARLQGAAAGNPLLAPAAAGMSALDLLAHRIDTKLAAQDQAIQAVALATPAPTQLPTATSAPTVPPAAPAAAHP